MLAEKIALVVIGVALFVLDAALCQNNLPAISLHPTGGVHSEGDTVTLSCMTENEVSSIQWFRDGVLLSNGPQLNIASFIGSNTGNYTCLATTNGVGTITSAIARLQLAVLEASPPGEPSSPYSQPAQYNEPLILSCGNLTSTPATTYSWRFDTFPIIPSDNAIIGPNDGLLYLQLVTATPETFVCTAHNPHIDASRTGYIQLTVQGDSSSSSVTDSTRVMMSAPQDTVAVVGDTVSFQCIVGGHPVPTADDIDWSYPDETPPRLSQQNAVLTIISVTTANAGEYSCIVADLPGVFTATLTVLIPPVISVPLGVPKFPIFGDSLTLTCGVSDMSVTEWYWYRDGAPITVDPTSGSHVIESVNTTMHSGLYQCFAYNAAGNDSSVTSVTVMTIPANLTETLGLSSTLLFEGSDISYRCTAHGAPPPTILWFRDGIQQIDIDTTSVNPESRETTSSVELMSVSVGDSGEYVCRAVNEVGGTEVGSEEARALLVVIVPTVIITPSPTQPLYALELERPATLPCQATAHEGAALHFSWEKDGAPLVYDGERVSLLVGNHSTNITFSTVVEGDSGIYQCKVTTMYEGTVGPTVESITINVTASPELLIPPQLRPIHAITSTSFKVSWYYPGADALAKLESYTVSYRIHGTKDPVAEHTQLITALTEYTVSSSETMPVKPYTVYVVSVWANYKTGERVGSVNVTVVTSEDVPGAPGEVTYTVINMTAVLMEWKQPEEPNGIITNYTLRYRQASSSNFITLPLSNTTLYELSPLLPKATYDVEVAASTAVGIGPFSESITVSTDLSESSETTALYQKAWFIVIMFVAGAVIVIALVLVIAFGARHVRKRRQKYSVQSRDEMEAMNGRHARSLTEEEMADYNGRASRRSGGDKSELSVGLALDGRESESSMGEKYSYEPSLSTTVSHMSSQAPAYINPPPFEEAIKRIHTPRMTPAYSGSTLERPPPSTTYTGSDCGLDSCSKTQFLESSPSPPHSYHPSPPNSYHTSPPHSYHTSPLPPTLPPSQPPPPVPQSPTHSENNYASIRKQRSEDKTMMSHPATPSPNGYNGYNVLPARPTAHETYLRSRTQYMMRASAQNMHTMMQTPLAKTSSQPNFATFV